MHLLFYIIKIILKANSQTDQNIDGLWQIEMQWANGEREYFYMKWKYFIILICSRI